MATPEEIRVRIEQCKQDLAHTQGREAALGDEIDEAMTKLRELLGCKRGEEKAAIKKLREQIDRDVERFDELIDKAEEAKP